MVARILVKPRTAGTGVLHTDENTHQCALTILSVPYVPAKTHLTLARGVEIELRAFQTCAKPPQRYTQSPTALQVNFTGKDLSRRA